MFLRRRIRKLHEEAESAWRSGVSAAFIRSDWSDIFNVESKAAEIAFQAGFSAALMAKTAAEKAKEKTAVVNSRIPQDVWAQVLAEALRP